MKTKAKTRVYRAAAGSRRTELAWLTPLLLSAALVLVSGCRREQAAFDHSQEHPEGHDHHEPGHGHGDQPVLRITHWNDQFELFAEHPALVPGQEAEMLAHITLLEGFRALEQAQLRLELQGPGTVETKPSRLLQPGVFSLPFSVSKPGDYTGRLLIEGATRGLIEGFKLTVFASAEAAQQAAPEEDDHGLIELLKQQQWSVPFSTAFAESSTLVASVRVAGSVETPPGGAAEVGAPVPGRVVAPPKGLPRPGDSVKKGSVLASLSPAPSSPEGAARAQLAVAEAEARASAAKTGLERAQRLLADEAISAREVEDARREAEVSEEAVRAAERAAALFSGATSGSGAGGWRLVAPISGTLTQVEARPGASVAQGEVLFRIVNDAELWIRARVPEQDAARLRTDRDAQYLVAGLDTWKPIRIEAKDATASLVTVGRTVDPVSRTVDVIYALSETDAALRVGGLVQVSLPSGEEFKGVVVPTSAVVDADGREIVYVQVDGEHFAERAVRTGPRSGDRIGILQGLEPGARIVTLGAHLVRLADRSSSSQPHGHIH